MTNREDLIITDLDYARLLGLARNAELASELERAIVVPSERVPSNVVTMHSWVAYVDETTGERREVKLTYPDESDAMVSKVSVLAPVGCALLGLSAGQAIEWPFPGGEVHRLRVEQILFQPEAIQWGPA